MVAIISWSRWNVAACREESVASGGSQTEFRRGLRGME